MKTQKLGFKKGFTIVEMMIVIVVIGIIATIVSLNFPTWQSTIAKNSVKSDLMNVATSFENEKNFNNGYPSTFPNNIKPSSNVILEMTNAGTGKYCVNGYHAQYPTIRMSINSDQKNIVQNSLCSGSSTGAVIGGTIPNSPTGVNIAPSLDNWTLTGTATYNSSTGELTLGTNGTATSPLVRVNGVTGININAQFYATTQAAYAGFQPNGGWHSGSTYWASDGTTAATNSGGYTANGCAQQLTLGSWNPSSGSCWFGLGPNVVYVKIALYSSAAGYSSPDLKFKSPSFILN